MRLVLASASPRRAEILSAAGIEFTVRPANVPEVPRDGEAPEVYVKRLAEAKATATHLGAGEVVLGADTVVVAGGRILEKPADAAEAATMLRELSGRVHSVMTGICLRGESQKTVDISITQVEFLPLTEEVIAEYAASGEGLDKAGAYAIQGKASRFVSRIDGCYFNVVGLPVSLVWRHLTAIAK